MLRANLYRTHESLRAIEAAWRDLSCPTPFGSWEFAHHWLESHGADTEPFVVAVTDPAERLVAIAPWSLVRRKDRLGQRHVTGMGDGDGWYHDPVGACDEAAWNCVIACLKEHRSAWDTLRLQLRPELCPGLVRQLGRLGPTIERRGEIHTHRLIDLSGGWERYVQGLPASLRRNLRSAERKLAGLSHRFVEASQQDGPRLLDELFRLHQARWTSEEASAAFLAVNSAAGWAAYYDCMRSLAMASLERGTPCLFALEIEGRVAAIDLVLKSGPEAYGTLRAYDPAFAPLSAGLLLNFWQFRHLHQDGVQIIDLGPGDFPYKERLKNRLRETVLVQVGSGLKGALYGYWHQHVKPWLSTRSARLVPGPTPAR